MLGDGDSKGYEEAKKFVNYNTEKLDCINYVAKHFEIWGGGKESSSQMVKNGVENIGSQAQL